MNDETPFVGDVETVRVGKTDNDDHDGLRSMPASSRKSSGLI